MLFLVILPLSDILLPLSGNPLVTPLEVSLWWDPPIIDGGAVVFEHEVSYSLHEVVRKDKYTKEDVVTPAEPYLASRRAEGRSRQGAIRREGPLPSKRLSNTRLLRHRVGVLPSGD